MKCYLSENSGFCFGVSLAVNAAYENIGANLYMYGEIVHNPVVVSELLNNGVKIINNTGEIGSADGAKVLIRAHGVSKATINELKAKGVTIIDKTCPKVKRVHNIVKEASERALDIIIVGNPEHPETIGTKGWSGTNTIVISDIDYAKQPNLFKNFGKNGVCVVAQTTHNKKKYEDIYDYLKTVFSNIEYHNTICDDTANRQAEIRRISKIADCVIIIGGKTSSNSTKLFEIASEYCDKTQHAESGADIDLSFIKDASFVAVASGASTPNKSIFDAVVFIENACAEGGIIFEKVDVI